VTATVSDSTANERGGAHPPMRVRANHHTPVDATAAAGGHWRDGLDWPHWLGARLTRPPVVAPPAGLDPLMAQLISNRVEGAAKTVKPAKMPTAASHSNCWGLRGEKGVWGRGRGAARERKTRGGCDRPTYVC